MTKLLRIAEQAEPGGADLCRPVPASAPSPGLSSIAVDVALDGWRYKRVPRLMGSAAAPAAAAGAQWGPDQAQAQEQAQFPGSNLQIMGRRGARQTTAAGMTRLAHPRGFFLGFHG